MHVAIAGNIGSGKTTLTNILSKYYKWSPHFEDIENNPYLFDFYKDMARWSFNLQVFFLGTRFNQILKIQREKRDTVQDRTIYEDCDIFARNLHEMNLLTARDFKNYRSLFYFMESLINPPDFLIYLRADTCTLVEHIHKRGRECERFIDIEYLSNLNEKYEDWIEEYSKGPKLIIDMNGIDYVNNSEDLKVITDKIDQKIIEISKKI